MYNELLYRFSPPSVSGDEIRKYDDEDDDDMMNKSNQM